MKHMIISFKIEGNVISYHFLTLWFQKDSLAIVASGTFRVGIYLFLETIFLHTYFWVTEW